MSEQPLELFPFGGYVRVLLYKATDRARHLGIALDKVSKGNVLTGMMIAGPKMAKVARDIAHQIVVRRFAAAKNVQLAFQKCQKPLEMLMLNMPRYCGIQDDALRKTGIPL